MKKLIILLLVVIPAMLPKSSWCQEKKQFDETGIFLDTLEVGAMQLRLGVTVRKDENGAFQASLNSIDQSSGEIAFSETNIDEKHIVLNSAIGVQIEGDFNDDYTAISAEFRQGPGKFPLVLRRVDALPVNKRPQEPKAPFPYAEEEVTFDNEGAGIQLAGTLTLPHGEGPFPAVILISGSGPQNRNEEILGHKPFLVLADYFTRNGIAVLRYDDRGIGKSTGDFGSATSGDFAQDALSALTYLKARKEIKANSIGLIGHSEGGMIAPLAAGQSDDVAFIVLLAGPGSNLGDNVIYQRNLMAKKGGASDEFIKVQEKCWKAINETVRKEIEDDQAREEIRQMYAALSDQERSLLNWNDQQLERYTSMMLGNWWRFGLRYNAEETIKTLKCPVLALLGEKDHQIPVSMNQKELEQAIETGNKNNKLVIVPGVNHLFQTCQTGEESEYAQIEETFSPAVMEIMKSWIQQVQTNRM